MNVSTFLDFSTISFNFAKLDLFNCAIEAIGQYDPNLKSPSYHELRVLLLKRSWIIQMICSRPIEKLG